MDESKPLPEATTVAADPAEQDVSGATPLNTHQERKSKLPSLGEVGPSETAWLFRGCVIFWVVGAYYRFWELGEQPLIGDEMHAFKSATLGTLKSITLESGFPDVAIPISLWQYALLNTIGLSEWGMRMPMLLSGLAFLPLLTWFVRRHIGAWESFAATGVACLSPLLIHHSRFARPYMPLVLLSLLITVCGMRYVAGRRHAVAPAVVLMGLSFAMSPVSVPAFGGLTLACVALRWRRDKEEGKPTFLHRIWSRDSRLLVGASVACVALLAFSFRQVQEIVTLLPEFLRDTQEGGRPVDWALVGKGLSGVREVEFLIWLGATSLLGGLACWWRSRSFAVVAWSMTLCQLLTIVLLVPWGDKPESIGRYCMMFLPSLLVWLALGLAMQADLLVLLLARVVPAPAIRATALGAAVLGLTWLGPLLGTFRSHNSFTALMSSNLDPPMPYGNEDTPGWPRFYNLLTAMPDDVVVMESPCVSNNRKSLSPYASYQLTHRKRVLLLNRRLPFRTPGVQMASTLSLDEDKGEEKGLGAATMLIVHTDFEGERLRMHKLLAAQIGDAQSRGGTRTIRPKPRTMKTDGILDERAEVILSLCAEDETLREIYSDEWIRVFSRDEEIIAAVEAWQASE